MDESDAELRLAAEQRARVLIDRQLINAGWAVQDRSQMNLYAGPGIAVREAIMAKGHGRADYLLYINKRTVGVSRPSQKEHRCREWSGNRRSMPMASRLRSGSRL